MKKSVMMLVLVVLLSSTVIAQDESCSGFWGSVSCFLWIEPENKTMGKSFYVGEGV